MPMLSSSSLHSFFALCMHDTGPLLLPSSPLLGMPSEFKCDLAGSGGQPFRQQAKMKNVQAGSEQR